MTCKVCKSPNHDTDIHYKVFYKLEAEGWPVSSSRYKSAHKAADIKEKEKFPSGYEKMKKFDRELPKKELAGKNTKSGKIEVSAKVPVKLRREVALHEKVESKHIKAKK